MSATTHDGLVESITSLAGTMDQSLKIIAAPSLREQVAERIRNAIVSGRFRPGDRLIERELCELISVSRTSVREALRELESEGLITMLPNRGGPIVSVVDATTAESIYQVRAVLEGLAAQLFAMRASDAQLRQVETAVQDLEVVYAGGDAAKILERKAEFYRLLLEGAGNEVATSMLNNIHTRVSLLRATTLADTKRAKESIAELRRIVAALASRDGQAALEASVLHVQNAGACALAILEKQKAAAPAGMKDRHKA
jgi:DNA-binding GntR family transcriptional regulator